MSGKWMMENVVREEGKGFLPLTQSILCEQFCICVDLLINIYDCYSFPEG